MKKFLLILILPVMLVVSSCDTLQTEEVLQNEAVLKSAPMVKNFRAHLSGDQEVPAVETNATGQAIFQLSKDGMTLSYKLIVANINDVRMAHIHLAPAGVNGGVVVWLYPASAPPVLIPGKSNGILAQGEITEADVTGALAAEDEPFEALLEAIKAGNTYVNVHTVAYGGGEIRGQINAN